MPDVLRRHLEERLMNIVRAAHAPVFDLPGISFTALAAPSRGSAQVCAWLLTVDPTFDPGESQTLDRDEVFVVVDGSIQWGDGGEIVEKGDAVVAVAGEHIRFTNPGEVPALVYVAIQAGFNAVTSDGTTIGTPPWAL
jgi:mannose-6-phosphate isomerase-like protein (cupin superfamily)